MRMRKSVLVIFVIFTLGFLCNSAFADPLGLYGLSSKSMGISQASTASANDYSATYYNPGRLGYVKNGFGLHFVASFDNVSISLKDRPGGYSVPDAIKQAWPQDKDGNRIMQLSVPTSELPNTRRDTTNEPNVFLVSGGGSYDFGLYWLRLGIAFCIPVTGFTTADFHYVDEREQYFSNQLHFQHLNRSANAPSFLFSLAFRPLKWLGFGVSANVFGRFEATGRMMVPNAAELDKLFFTMDIALKYDARAIAGIYVEPLEWLGIGIAFRDRSYYGMKFDNNLRVRDFEVGKEGKPEVTQAFDYTYGFTPRKFSLGMRFDFSIWSVSVDGAYLRWSEFWPEIESEDGANYSDTYTVRAGTEVHPLKWLDVRFGASWVPSPVPYQDGRTNFVDNDRVEAAAGLTFHLPWVEGLSIDVHAQLLVLLPQSVDKSLTASNGIVDEFPDDIRHEKTNATMPEAAGLQTNNPGFPGYSSKGFVGTAGLGINYQFK